MTRSISAKDSNGIEQGKYMVNVNVLARGQRSALRSDMCDILIHLVERASVTWRHYRTTNNS